MESDSVALSMSELRAVVKFSADFAAELLPEFEAVTPSDPRPRDALEAARVFVDGARRSNRQRAAAFASHRAAKSVSSEIARLAALACGDAAAAAYLHPIAKATQVGHILRSAACAARVIEVKSSDAMVGAGFRRIAARAIAPVPDVLRRYPAALPGNSRLSQLVCELDSAIRYGTGEA